MTAVSSSMNGRPSAGGRSYSDIQVIEAEVSRLIKSNFSATLGTITDITKLVLACIYHESRFNPAANSGLHGETQFQRFKKYPAIAAKYASNKTTEGQKVNLRNSVAGFGLMQATGWYTIKGAGPDGKNELMRMRPDLAGPLLIEPGEDVNTVLGPDKLENQILAGLIILEAKYKIANSQWSNPPTAAKPYSSRLAATFGGYLGQGYDKFGSDPMSYASSIIQGDSYRIANSGYTSRNTADGDISKSPAKTAASGTNPGNVGCCTG